MAAQHDVDLASVTGTGVGGRIRKQDVLDAAAQQGTTAPPPTAAAQAAAAQPAAPAAAAAPGRSGRTGRRHRVDRASDAARDHGEDVAAPQGHRHPDDRVAADQRPADHGGRGRHHVGLAAARQREGRVRPARGREAVVHAVLREGRDRRAEGAPQAQRRDRHREGRGHLLRPREHRDRRRHREGPAHAGHQGRRRPVDRGPGPQDRRRGRAHPHQQDHPRRAVGRHLHADQHRQPRGAVRHPDHQPAAGRHPGHRRGGEAGRGDLRPQPRRDDRGAPDGLPRAHLRPPPGGRRGRRPVPQ